MKNYEIVNATITHPTEGVIAKENIIYYDPYGGIELIELYSIRGEIIRPPRPGYELLTN